MPKKQPVRRAKVQSSAAVDFELHSLGWKAFQDLCVTILREVLAQTVQQFFDSNDGGRDGAFGGVWQPTRHNVFSGNFTVQCKFTAKRDKHLSVGDLKDELEKARRLAANGLADTYVLMTNAKLKGVADEKLKELFLAIEGLEHFTIFGQEWISNAIRESSRLRMLVPRVYGLGDLSQILDERAYAQATEVLSSLGDDLAKFVITDSHRQSAKAIVEHGFVLLLGEPASGKSTIAAALAVGAIDEWGCSTLKVRDSNEFVKHWNPHEPKQFFWIDDAFGATQVDWSKTTDWNHVFPDMQAAIRRGARVVFTSRNYIFNAARQCLKESAFPLLAASQVIIQVDKLSQQEREQILYNHMKLGRQPVAFRTEIKPHLPMVASHSEFKPEIARRLSDPLFTKAIALSALSINQFVARPLELLVEVIRTLDPGSRSALAAVFMRGGTLPSPMDLSVEEKHAVELIGGDVAKVRESLSALNESLVLKVREGGAVKWQFKHPTIRDAFATLVADDVELLDIYLTGSPAERLLEEVSCGDLQIKGVKVVVPNDRFPLVIRRFEALDSTAYSTRRQLLRFLSRRCNKMFLKMFIASHADFISSLNVSSDVRFDPDLDMIARLHELHLLPEEKRVVVIATLTNLAVETPDAGFLDEEYRKLFSEDEFVSALDAVKKDLIPDLDSVIDAFRDSFDPGENNNDPENHFDALADTTKTYRHHFEDNDKLVHQINQALETITKVVDELRSEYQPRGDDDFYDDDRASTATESSRSIFDDVDS